MIHILQVRVVIFVPHALVFFSSRQDVSEDLKLSLNDRIELALADQGWEWLASLLGRNDRLNVRLLLELLLLYFASVDGVRQCAYVPKTFSTKDPVLSYPAGEG